MTTACSHPIRLRGWQERIDAETGELLAQIVTAREPGGVLLVACGDRRAANCPSCAETYRHDAFQLVAAGLRGGKGVPEAVAENPAVMVTLTAPSFGPVHTIRDRDGSCPCGGRHVPDDDVLGVPVDTAAYRYLEQAAWNHLAPILWKRTIQAVRRDLARELGLPGRRLRDVARVRFVKASEFQRRGAVHYHAVLRLDGPGEPGSEPAAPCAIALLERVIRRAVRSAEISVSGQRVHWGREVEIVPLDFGEVGPPPATSPSTRPRRRRSPLTACLFGVSARPASSPRSTRPNTRGAWSLLRGASAASRDSKAPAAGRTSSATADTRSRRAATTP